MTSRAGQCVDLISNSLFQNFTGQRSVDLFLKHRYWAEYCKIIEVTMEGSHFKKSKVS